MLDSRPFHVHHSLSPVRRAIGIRRFVRWTLRGLAGGAACGALLSLALHYSGRSGGPVAALGACLAGLLLAALFALWRWPSRMDAARTVDRHFGLKDRVTTALEFEPSDEPLIVLQRRDVGGLIGGLPLHESARGRPHRGEILGMVVAAALLAVALALPSHRSPVSVAARSGVPMTDAVRQAALAHVRVISRDFQAGLTAEQRQSSAARQALSVLSRLQSRLKRASTQEEALREISQAQMSLQRVTASLHPVSGTAASRLVKALKGNLTREEQAEAMKGRRHLDQVTSKLLQRLASSASLMSEKQKSDVARALQRAANAMPDDPVRSDLRQAATALGHHDVKTARQALKHAATRFKNSQDQRATGARVNTSRSNLNSVKSDVNGTHHKPLSTGTDNGPAPPPNTLRSGLQGGTERGERSPNAGIGDERGRRTSPSRPQGRRGEDGASTGGGKRGTTGHSPDHYAVVYVPGLVSKGARLLPYELHGAPKRVPAIPYRQVIAQYQRSARTSLDRSPLPPSVQEYVRRYFTALSHQ